MVNTDLQTLNDPTLTTLTLSYLKESDVEVPKEELRESCYQLAKVFYDKSDLVKADQLFRKTLELSVFPKNIFSMLKVLGFMIRIASERLNDQEAERLIVMAEELVEKMPQVLGSLNAEYFYNNASIKTYRGEFKEAEENFKLAAKRAKEENDPELLTKCLLALASNSYKMSNFDEAIQYITQLEQLLTIVDKSYVRGSMCLVAAKVYKETGDIQLSKNYFSQANAYLKNKKCWNLLGYLLLGKGNLYKRAGEFEKARLLYELAQESVDVTQFVRLGKMIGQEINDVDDNSVDIYLDRTNRKIFEPTLGTIDFKHRFILLEILFLLAQNPGKFYDKDKLAQSIWKDEYNPLIHDKLIYTSVSRLRKLIEPKGKLGKRKFIIRGKDGYTFNPIVKIRFQSNINVGEDSSIGNVEISSPV